MGASFLNPRPSGLGRQTVDAGQRGSAPISTTNIDPIIPARSTGSMRTSPSVRPKRPIRLDQDWPGSALAPAAGPLHRERPSRVIAASKWCPGGGGADELSLAPFRASVPSGCVPLPGGASSRVGALLPGWAPSRTIVMAPHRHSVCGSVPGALAALPPIPIVAAARVVLRRIAVPETNIHRGQLYVMPTFGQHLTAPGVKVRAQPARKNRLWRAQICSSLLPRPRS